MFPHLMTTSVVCFRGMAMSSTSQVSQVSEVLWQTVRWNITKWSRASPVVILNSGEAEDRSKAFVWTCETTRQWGTAQLGCSNYWEKPCRHLVSGGGGTRWCSWVRHCATSRKVAGSIPDVVTGIFHWHIPSGRNIGSGVDSVSNRNGYHKYFIGSKDGRCVRLPTLSSICAECLGIW
jgi:hypothetical protein